jgi:hypothetical protein
MVVGQGAQPPSPQPRADAAQSDSQEPSASGASDEPNWTRVRAPDGTYFECKTQMLDAREALIRKVRAYIDSGDDPDGSGRVWCKANAEGTGKLAIWAIEELQSYRAAEQTLEQARSEAGVPCGRPRAEYFQSLVRMEGRLRILASRRRNPSGQGT